MLQKRNIAFIVSAMLLCVAVYAVYPYYQYYVDPDATAYLTITKRYLQGDLGKAINGYWSPWSCWLTAAWVHYLHWELMAAAVAVNTLGAVGFLFITHSFLKYFDVKVGMVWVCELTLVVFLSYAVYGQLFDDLWECFFLLAGLRLMLGTNFLKKEWMWLVVGELGALAYFAKAYALPFFVLNTIVCLYFVTEDKKQWIKISLTCIATMATTSALWIVLLHDKYDVWMTSSAGKLNLSWYVVGHPYWKEGITHLVPPIFSDSPYYWEDPWVVNGDAPNALSSFGMLKMQLMRIPFNILKMIRSISELSAVFVVIFGAMLAVVVSLKVRNYFPERMRVVAISFVLFPLGYLLINFEARYLWYMLPLGMVMGALLVEKVLAHFDDCKWMRPKVYTLFVLSFVWFPVLEMKKMYKVGEADMRLAQRLQQEGIKGSFTVRAEPGAEVQGIERLAYFSGMQFYAIPNTDMSHEELLREMEKYGVDHYVHFYDKAEGANFKFVDANGREVPEEMKDETYGIRVFGPLH